MSTRIKIIIEGTTFTGELNDSKGGRAAANALPFMIRMSRWGDEYYGDIDLDISEDETARDIMEVGEIAFWPPGSALCLFFGPTPASTDQRPRAASNVVPLGTFSGDLNALRSQGSSVKVEVDKE